MIEQGKEKNKTSIIDEVKRLATLYIENAKLTTAEKLTVLMSTVALLAIIYVLLTTVLLIAAFGLCMLLSDFMAPYWSFFIIAGLFILAIVIVYVFRQKLLEDPIARFLSKLLLDPEKRTEHGK